MRWLSRLLVVLIVCLVLIPVPTVPAQAAGAYISLSPNSGVPGEEVKVYGHNFTADEWVDIYYDLDGDGEWTSDEWVADVRADGDGDFRADFEVQESYKGYHGVFAEDLEGRSASMNFNVKPGLTISPEDGPVGITVTVEGHGFAEEEQDIELIYYINGDYETVAENIEAGEDGSWEETFKIPPSGKGNHNIDARGEQSTSSQVEDAFFEVTPGISLDKSSGSPGESITMTGSGFYANERDIRILFAGQEMETEIIRADETGYWEEDFEVPEMPKGEYSITAEGEQTSEEDIGTLSFEIEPGLVLSPEEGHVGTDLTVNGGGFAASKNVVIKYDGSQKTTAATNNKGSFEASFLVPVGIHGAHQVTAEDAAGNNATATFTMESDPPPTPELSSPLDASRVGIIGRVRPTFEWSAVSDESGVHYSLQIARGQNVTATGEFADYVVSVTDIVGTNYTLEKALGYGTYYWIVQAVDGAENAGNWTAAGSFQAGVLPLWAFILIIVAIVVGVGAAVYFFVIRKRIYYY
jgi:hypothetical protein